MGFPIHLAAIARKRANPFVGPLDAYTANLAGAWSAARRLLSAYTGPLVRVRRSSDSVEQDIGFTALGFLDMAALTSFVGSDDWFFRKVYDQSGAGVDIGQSSASAQPQGAVDGNGLAYGYAPGVGFSNTSLVSGSGLGATITNSTMWSVSQTAAYATDLGTLRFADITEGRTTNYADSIQNSGPGSGTAATLSGPTTGLYSVVRQFGAAGNRLTNGLATGTGTRTSAAGTLDVVGFGFGGGGATWSQNSKFYAMAIWSADLGDSSADAVQVIGKGGFFTL